MMSSTFCRVRSPSSEVGSILLNWRSAATSWPRSSRTRPRMRSLSRPNCSGDTASREPRIAERIPSIDSDACRAWSWMFSSGESMPARSSRAWRIPGNCVKNSPTFLAALSASSPTSRNASPIWPSRSASLPPVASSAAAPNAPKLMSDSAPARSLTAPTVLRAICRKPSIAGEATDPARVPSVSSSDDSPSTSPERPFVCAAARSAAVPWRAISSLTSCSPWTP